MVAWSSKEEAEALIPCGNQALQFLKPVDYYSEFGRCRRHRDHSYHQETVSIRGEIEAPTKGNRGSKISLLPNHNQDVIETGMFSQQTEESSHEYQHHEIHR
jgi:hypothetical protein